jgi:hypothetical protein
VFVAAVIGLLAAAVLVPVVVFVWLIYAVGRPLV